LPARRVMNKTFAIALFSLSLATGAAAAPITYTTLLSGPNEFPANASPGVGSATVIYDDVLHTLSVSADFSGLTGTTTAAHIHCCVSPSAAVPTAGVATQTPSFIGFPLGVTFGTFSNVYDLTLASSWRAGFITASGGTTAAAEAVLAAGLAAGEAYFNIHTSTFGGGEIRGFFKEEIVAPVPEPGTYALMGAGIAGLALLRRRARR
jgi:hypothetical protein